MMQSPVFQSLSRMRHLPLMAPFYHAVSDEPMPHIRHLYRVKTVRAFEADLDFLLKYYTPVDFHALPAILEGRWAGAKPPMLLSFDDGLRQFHDPIAPVLIRKGIPAICFLNSAFLDNKALFYRYKASVLIDHLMRQGQTDQREMLLAIKYNDQAKIDALATGADCNFDQFLAQYQPYLTIAQVEQLIHHGFHFGAHSHDHPAYQHLPLEAQLQQTTHSVESIYNTFGLGYRLFSFPFTDFGVARAFFDFVLRDKKVADYTFGCAGLKKDIYPQHIQRIPMEQTSLDGASFLHKTLLFYLLKTPLGRNQLHRS